MKQAIRKTTTIALTAALTLSAVLPLANTNAIAKAPVRLNKTTVYLLKGESVKLKLTGTKKKVTWKSGRKKIAVVNKKGKVTAKKTGNAIITAKAGKTTRKCKVIVESKNDRSRRLAKALKQYVIKKGTYYKGDGTYTLTANETDDNSGYTTVMISVKKSSNVMTFTWRYQPDAPADVFNLTMNINLISKTAKKGTLEYRWSDAYEDQHSMHYAGTISRAFNGRDAGIDLTSASETIEQMVEYDDESEGTEYVTTEITDELELKQLLSSLTGYTARMFDAADRLLLKKAKTSMKKIGFSSYAK